MIIDYISIIISFSIIILFVITPRTPSFLLLIFIIIYFVICWWHIYKYPINNTYMASLPNYLAGENYILNKSISEIDLFITVSLFIIVILISTF